MSIWNDLFDIYTSVSSEDSSQTQLPARSDDDQTEEPQQTVYVFAYLDDGKGNISRNIAVEDRITLLEMKNQELENRYNTLLEELKKYDDFQSED